MKGRSSRDVASWVLYDWANSAFATTVMAGFFPLYFKTVLSRGVDVTVSTARLGTANAAGVLLIALATPILGAASDLGGFKKRLLFLFTVVGAAASMLLAWAPEGGFLAGALCYALAAFGFGGATVFYDALLPSVARGRSVDRVSAAGYAWGYLGGGLLFAFNVAMFLKPSFFGLADSLAAVRASFISVGVWWLVFAVPLFLFVREPPALDAAGGLGRHIVGGMRDLAATLRHVRANRRLFLFLGAFLLYNDGVGTTIKMAVDFGLSVGLEARDLMGALLMVQFIGFPAAWMFGRLAARFHPKPGIFACLGVYLFVVLWAFRLRSPGEFYVLAGLIGLVQGGIQALSRSFFARLFPPERSGEFFGLYNLAGRVSGIVGPLLVGWTALGTGQARAGILAIAVLFIGGGLLLSRVRAEETGICC